MNALPVDQVEIVGPGAPDAEAPIWRDRQLRSTLAFLFLPVSVLLASQFLDTEIPNSVAALLGVLLVPRMFWRAARDPEWVMAAFIVYLPLVRLYPLLFAPGLNGLNLLMLGLIVGWVGQARRQQKSMFAAMPLSRAMWVWCGLSCLSFLTALVTRGPSEFIEWRLPITRIWLDQFFVFFAFLGLIRDTAMARRMAIYLCIGGAVVSLCGFSEWLQKAGSSSIEKSRLLGPLNQPNDLAAFVAYASGPFIAVFIDRITRLRVWLLAPYLFMVARVLIGTFSRGGYIAYGVEALVALTLRGKLFFAFVFALGMLTVEVFPEVVPESLMARMHSTNVSDGQGSEGLDKSSQDRLFLWDAALKMTWESPLLGKGFITFPFLKGDYTEVEVDASDNHNMYLYITSQMGIPALISVLVVFAILYVLSVRVYRRTVDPWTRAIGLGTASMVGGVAAVNMFGSRMVDVSVMGYVWMYAAVISHLWVQVRAESPAKRALEIARLAPR